MVLSPSKREFDIDFFRGWVCISLMFLHFYNALYIPFYSMFGDRGIYILWNWRLGVESFFVLAGFLMAHMFRPVPGESVSVGGYLKRRFFRLIVPYWIAMLLFGATRWAAHAITRGGTVPTLQELLAQMFLVQDFFVQPERFEKVIPSGYWSMVALEQFYLLWLCLYAVCLCLFGQMGTKGDRRTERIMTFLTLAICLGSLALNIWPNVSLTFVDAGWEMVQIESNSFFFMRVGTWHYPMELPQSIAFLALGMLLYWSIRQKAYRVYFWLAVALIFVGACWTGQSRLWKALVATAIFFPLARGIRLPNVLVFRWLTYIGKRSYSIYLIHSIVGFAFISLTYRLTAKGDWVAIPLTLAAMVLSVLAALVFYHLVEVPCQTKSRSIDYRRKQPAQLAQRLPVADSLPTPALSTPGPS